MRARLFCANLLALAVLLAWAEHSGAQVNLGTAITYQGQLIDAGAPASGPYDLRFALFNTAADEGSEVGSPLTLEDVPITNGVFTVQLDFGNVFDDTALWLGIEVRAGASTDSFRNLEPRQQLTAAPYALHSKNAWNLTGNLGTAPGINFVGTTDSQPLIFKTNNTEAMRLDADGNLSVGSPGTFAKFEASGLATGGIAVMGTSTTRAVLWQAGTRRVMPGHVWRGWLRRNHRRSRRFRLL